MKANVGMIYPVASQVDTYTPNSSITYKTGFVVDEAREATVSWNESDGEFYGDNALLDVDNSVTGYSIDFETTGLKDTIRASLLGATKSSDEYTITGAPAPEVGFGFIRNMRDDSSGTVTDVFEAWWFYRVRFGHPNENSRTKEGSTEWRAPAISGKGMGVYLTNNDEHPNFAVHETCNTLSAAKTWLQGKANIGTVTT